MSEAGKILVIEDDDFIRRNLVDALEFEGYSAEAVSNGKLGLDYLSGTPQLPQLILLDLMMPVMNGFQFLENLGRAPKNQNEIPIIVLTASREKVRVRGAVKKILRKPIDLDVLLQAIKENVAPVP